MELHCWVQNYNIILIMLLLVDILNKNSCLQSFIFFYLQRRCKSFSWSWWHRLNLLCLSSDDIFLFLALIISFILSVAATTQSATAWTVVDTRRIASVAKWRGPYDDARRRPRVPWPRRSPISRPHSLFLPSTVLPIPRL